MEQDSGCQHGISFLVYERSTCQLLEIFFGNKSSRPEAKKLYPYMMLTQADIERRRAANADVEGLVPHPPIPVTLKVRVAENKKKQTWHVPMVVKCSAPFNKVPSSEYIGREITKFLTVKSGGVEKVTEPTSHKRAR